jgi:hypothetical protein
MAEGGRHLDDAIVGAAGRVLGTLAAILAEGRKAGRFGDVHPMTLHIGIVAPLVFFAASAPVRARFAPLLPGAPALSPDAMVAHVEAATLSVLEHAAGSRRTRPSRRRRR